MVRKYEVLYILKHDSAPEKTDATRAKMRDIIESQGGMLIKEDVWGKRKLAFEVKKYQKGIYVQLVFLAKPDSINELERNLKINAEVIRFLTVKLKDEINLDEEKAEKEKWEQELALRQTQPPPPEVEAEEEKEPDADERPRRRKRDDDEEEDEEVGGEEGEADGAAEEGPEADQ